MADEIETLLVAVRADTQLFARDVAAMKAELAGPFAAGADQAGRMLENALIRALRTGKLGFEDLKRVALSAMAEIPVVAINCMRQADHDLDPSTRLGNIEQLIDDEQSQRRAKADGERRPHPRARIDPPVFDRITPNVVRGECGDDCACQTKIND